MFGIRFFECPEYLLLVLHVNTDGPFLLDFLQQVLITKIVNHFMEHPDMIRISPDLLNTRKQHIVVLWLEPTSAELVASAEDTSFLIDERLGSK